jgi:hypothetical protein
MKGILVLFAVATLLSCAYRERKGQDFTLEGLPVANPDHVKAQLQKFAPTEIRYDDGLLDPREKQVLENLIQAARSMDEIFLRQVDRRNVELRENLLQSSAPNAEIYKNYFRIHFGPFDRLEEDTPFIGSEQKPEGATFYPPDMTKEEFLEWLRVHPEDREAFESNFTVIHREGKNLVAVPYSVEYKQFLEPAAEALSHAAELALNPSLKMYLAKRAEAFLSNDYYESDLAWMDIEGSMIDPTIGPYEVYEDRLMGYKAAFEAFITIVDVEESRRFEEFGKHLPELEMNLPIPDEFKNTSRGLESPTSVASLVFSAGDTKAGIQTIAFNLPNDERVREAKGSKKVMLKNVIRAKFEKILVPISREVLAEDLAGLVSFDAYFYETYLHEMAHGLGPGKIIVNGVETTVNKELREHYSVIEEAKADIVGLYNALYFHEKGLLPQSERETLSTFLAGLFRSIRFGVEEAHGGANLIELNFLSERGVTSQDPKSLVYRIDFEKARQGVEELAKELLMLEALGDYRGASEFIARYGVLTDRTREVLGKLGDIPVDIDPVYTRN